MVQANLLYFLLVSIFIQPEFSLLKGKRYSKKIKKAGSLTIIAL